MFLSKTALCASVAACALVLGGAAAHAQDGLTLPSAALATSLNTLSRTAGVEILADPALLRGKAAPAVRAASSEAALAELLRGSGLTYQRRGDAFMIVQSGGAPRPSSDPAADRASDPRTTHSASAPQTTSSTESDQAADNLEEIVVTGTRITQTGYNAPVPLTVIDNAQISMSGSTTIADTLRNTPAIAVGLDNTNGSNTTDGGAAFINLRGLGTNRTLTLVNGRRRVSGSSTSSAVDVNTIPAAMIDRVELTTGGSSAIYGADAVSGVVNIITKKNFDGFEVMADGGVSSRGDARQYSLSLFEGSELADGRGHVGLGVSYNKVDPLIYSQRSYLSHPLSAQPNPANTGPNDGIPNTKTYSDVFYAAQSTYAGIFLNNTTYTYGRSGLINSTPQIVFSPGVLTFGTGYPSDAGSVNDFNVGATSAVRLKNETLSMRGDMSYEVMDRIRFFAEGEFAQTKSASPIQYYRFDDRPSAWGAACASCAITNSLDSYFLPPDVASLMRANNVTSVGIRKRMKDMGVVTDNHARRIYSLITGFDGTLFDNLKWDVSYQYGQTHDDIVTTNLLRRAEFKYATDVIADPATGQPVCRDITARAAGCVPYNVWGTEPLTQAQRDYFVAARQQDARNIQDVFAAHLSGDLFNLPAGKVAFVVGAERRTERLQVLDDNGQKDGSIRWGVGTTATYRAPLDEEFKVTEEYGEVLVPVLKGLPFIQAVDFNAAVRASNYNTIGKTVAWQAGANWKVSDDVRLRFTRSRSVRAPNLLELYGPVSELASSLTNPCGPSNIDTTANRRANCVALGAPATGGTEIINRALFVSGGNPEVKEETSNSWAVGAVITPRFMRNFSVSLDYFNIEIADAVNSFGTAAMFRGCLDASSMSGNNFCEHLTFLPNSDVSRIESVLINASQFSTSGLDFAASYRVAIGGNSRIGLSFNGTYLFDKKFLGVEGEPTTLDIQAGEYSAPRLRANFTVSYDRDNWGVSLKNRIIGKSVLDKQALPEATDIRDVPAKVYTDATLKFDLPRGMSAYFGVNNAFDIKPPQLAGVYNYSAYDLIGRYFHMGMKAKY